MFYVLYFPLAMDSMENDGESYSSGSDSSGEMEILFGYIKNLVLELPDDRFPPHRRARMLGLLGRSLNPYQLSYEIIPTREKIGYLQLSIELFETLISAAEGSPFKSHEDFWHFQEEVVSEYLQVLHTQTVTKLFSAAPFN